MSFERPPVSKFTLQAQLLNRLVRASFDNIRGAREIAETSGQLERHSYNVSLVAKRHRATAQPATPTTASTNAATRAGSRPAAPRAAAAKPSIAQAFGVAQPRRCSHSGIRKRGTMLPPTAEATSTTMMPKMVRVSA